MIYTKPAVHQTNKPTNTLVEQTNPAPAQKLLKRKTLLVATKNFFNKLPAASQNHRI
jgi:hypothetical protein